MIWIFYVNAGLLPGMIKIFIDLFNPFGGAFLDKMAQIMLCILVPGIYRDGACVRTLALCQNHRLGNLAGRLLIDVDVGRPSAQPLTI